MTDWALDPLPILRNAHTQLADVGALELQLAAAASDVTTATAAAPEVFEQAMGAGLQDAVAQYQENAGAVVQYLRYVRSVNGVAQVILDAGLPAPPEDQLVHLTVAVSAAELLRTRRAGPVIAAGAGAGATEITWLRVEPLALPSVTTT